MGAQNYLDEFSVGLRTELTANTGAGQVRGIVGKSRPELNIGLGEGFNVQFVPNTTQGPVCRVTN